MERVVPNVTYNISLNDPDMPYQVTLDPQKIGRFLQKTGIPHDEIINTEIIVKKSSRSELASSEQSGDRNRLNIITDDAWEDYGEAMEQAMKLSYGMSDEEADFEDILYTKRLGNYLKKPQLQEDYNLLLNCY